MRKVGKGLTGKSLLGLFKKQDREAKLTPDSLKNISGNSRSGDLFLIAAVFAWGINFPIAKYVLQYMDPVVFSATRYLAAAFLLFVLLVFQGVRLRVTRQEVWLLIVIGLLGITLFQGGWAYGLSLTSASKASVLITHFADFWCADCRLSGKCAKPESLVWYFSSLPRCRHRH